MIKPPNPTVCHVAHSTQRMTAGSSVGSPFTPVACQRPPRPRSHVLFEHLHFLYTGDGPPGAEKAPIPSRPSAMDKQSGSGGHKQARTSPTTVIPQYFEVLSLKKKGG